MRDLPHIREITTEDYHPRNYADDIGGAAWIASTARIRELLERQHAGEFRLRLILREAVDLKPGRRDPRRMFEYDLGPMHTTGAEVVMETKDGRQRRVNLRGTRAEAFVRPTYRPERSD